MEYMSLIIESIFGASQKIDTSSKAFGKPNGYKNISTSQAK